MARKKGFDYFDAMYQLSINTKEAALILDDIITNYSTDYLKEHSKKIYSLEKAGDEIVYSIMHDLKRSFITPIDREDIITITESLDNVLDGINAIPHLFDNLVIEKLRENTHEISSIIIEMVEELTVIAKEFSKFKNTKKMEEMVKKINKLEEKADIFYSRQVKYLFTNEQNPIEIIKWKEVFDRLERIANDCERAAVILEVMRIKNT